MNDFTKRQHAFANVPAHQLLGLRITHQSKERTVVEMDGSQEHTQDPGIVQGGILSVLADAAAANLFEPYLPENIHTTSIEFKMNFLRPVLADGGRVVARASALRRGRRVSVAEVEILQKEMMVAKGLFTYLMVDTSGKSDRP